MNRIKLRALTIDDLENTNKWHSDQELYQTLGGPFRFVSLDAERDWLVSKCKFLNSEINLVICLVEDDIPIGLISVRDIDWITRCGYLAGIFIGDPDLRGRGYGVEALSLMVNHCFKDLGLNRIYAQILKNNQASLKTFKECGFFEEGLLRQHAFKDGQFKDVLLLGLCADQYKKE